MKRNYLISVIVMGLIVLSLYSTYAMFTNNKYGCVFNTIRIKNNRV